MKLPSLNILLFEDNIINQKLMVRLLEQNGHRVTVACNGRVGLELFDSGMFDLILMDIQMPEMDGFEATMAIRDNERKQDRYTPIIAVTAHCLHGERERCLRTGMNGFTTKPVRAQELFAEVARVVAAA